VLTKTTKKQLMEFLACAEDDLEYALKIMETEDGDGVRKTLVLNALVYLRRAKE